MGKIISILLMLLAFSFQVNAAVDLNTANQAELESLSGIGPAKAKAIIDYRKTHGGFESTEDIVKVDGIGQGTLKKLGENIIVKKKLIEVPSKGRIPSSVAY